MFVWQSIYQSCRADDRGERINIRGGVGAWRDCKGRRKYIQTILLTIEGNRERDVWRRDRSTRQIKSVDVVRIRGDDNDTNIWTTLNKMI
jgi:hypothetical protein